MNAPILISMEAVMDVKAKERRSGRPRAIPEGLIPEVFSLYQDGLGYRAIARELEREGIVVSFSTVRRVIKTRKRLTEPRGQP
jgi:transposase-like protein